MDRLFYITLIVVEYGLIDRLEKQDVANPPLPAGILEVRENELLAPLLIEN